MRKFPIRVLACLLSGAWFCICALSCDSAATPAGHADNQNFTGIRVSKTTSSVTTVVAEVRLFQYLIQSNGKIRSFKEQLVFAENAGRVTVCHASTGARFGSGSLIVQVDTAAIRQKVERVKLAQFNALREYESQLLGYETLLKDKSKEQAADIRKKLRISTGLAIAEQELLELITEMEKTMIRAPFSGILADVKVQAGELLKPGQELFRIYDPQHLLLEVKVLESDIPLIRKGTPAELSPVSDAEQVFGATVAEINPYVDEHGLVTIKLAVGARRDQSGAGRMTERMLFPGMNCMAVIRVPAARSLLVPKDAVVMRSGRAVVFTVEQQKAHWHYVVTGRENGQEIEIKEGLKPGVQVITSNNLQLAHEAPVEVVKSADTLSKE